MVIYNSKIPYFEPVVIEGYDEFKNYYGNCEMQTKEWLLNNLHPDSIFVDVGANVGILTLTAGKVIGEAGKIIAIEPTSTFHMLQRNLRRPENNHKTPTELINRAIGRKSEIRFDSVIKIWGDTPESSYWDFVALDDLMVEMECNKIDVIKIDTDGYEMEVLEGASKTLNQFYPAVVIEINEGLRVRDSSPDQVFDFFLDHRYTDVLLVDDHNYIFSSNWKIGEPWPNTLRLSRWRKNTSCLVHKGKELKLTSLVSPANEKVFFENNLLIRAHGKLDKWNYILDLTTKELSTHGPIVAEIHGTLFTGRISAAIIADDYQTFLSREVDVKQQGRFKISLLSSEWHNRAVIRNFENGEFSFEIEKIIFYEAETIGTFNKNRPAKSFVNINLLEDKQSLFQKMLLPTDGNFYMSFPNQKHQGWSMEQNSSHLLIDIVCSFQKPKVLEIGTREGYSASILLKNTNAEIWTVDSNEYIDSKIYPSRYTKLTDEGNKKTGWLYKELNYKNRVHQIFTNLNLFDWEYFENYKFDVVFFDTIDSNASSLSQILRIMPKIKKCGIVIWNNFNFEEELVSRPEDAVNNFVKSNIDWLNSNFALFYLVGTQFLIGKKLQ